MKLRRGRTYRLTFEAEVVGEALVVGRATADAFGTWTRSRVTVDEDEGLLAVHLLRLTGRRDAFPLK